MNDYYKTASGVYRSGEPDFDFIYKVLLIGDTGVGKSCLLARYCDDFFHEGFISTIGVDFKIKTLPLENSSKYAKLQIWDTAGQERFRAITSSYYRGSSAIILVYDATNRESFSNISRVWWKETERYAKENVLRILVANKTDKPMLQVTNDEGKQLAESLNMQFMAASAKTGSGVEEVFADTVNRLYVSGMQSLPINRSLPPARKVEVDSSACCVLS